MLRCLRKSQTGIALTEFALILPLFVFAAMGGMELAWEAIVRQKIQRIAATTADNTSRIRGVINETDINEIMTAARLNGEGLDLHNRGRIIVSSIQRNSRDHGDWIRWQRCFGQRIAYSNHGKENDGKNDNSIQGIDGDREMSPPPGVALILAEIEYKHRPLNAEGFFGEKVFRYEMAFIVRDRNDLSLGNNPKLPQKDIMTCQ